VNIPSGRSFVAFAAGALLSVAGATRTPAAPLPPAVDSAITTDLPRDASHPAAMYQLAIPSHDAALFGVFYRASGGDPHATVLMLHGLPGFEQNGDLAQTLRRAGWNVLIFHYRGAWGSGGTFSFSNCIDDVQAALDYLRAPENVARLGIDPRRLALIGHSMGGFLAGIAAMRDEAVLGAALISPWNPGVLATNPSPQLEKAQLDEFRSDVGPLAGTTPEALLEETKKNAAAWDLAGHAALWKSRPVLVVEADDFLYADDVAIAAALRKIPSAQLTELHIPTDHAYSDHRIALAAALLGWLKQLEPPRLPRHSERVRESGITDSR
jgi:pimeloyl-ACP methyl ester carboxylesterase